MRVLLFDENGDEIKLPTHKEVCGRCKGTGKHVNPAVDGNGITESDRMDWADDDFMEDYMNGVYDVRCEECDGNNVVDVVDVERLSPELRKQYEDAIEEEYDYRSMQAAERRMGA